MKQALTDFLSELWPLIKPHPWHGVDLGSDAPGVVTTYIEIVPLDTVKYEVDKVSGYLKVDRPQRYSNVCPTLYGFLPQTLCDLSVGERCAERTGRMGIIGDQDPLDVCVFTERDLAHGDLLLRSIPIGGLRLVDGNEADDKILAVLEGDAVYGQWRDSSECHPALIERLRHYFLTYKDAPGTRNENRFIAEVYGCAEAHEVIRRSRLDYDRRFPELRERIEQLRANVLRQGRAAG